MDRPRCPQHGLVVADDGGCVRCFRPQTGASTRVPILLGTIIAALIVAMLVMRVVTAVRERPMRALSSAPIVTASGDQVSVRLYSAAYCGWCAKAKAHMDQRGIAYTELRIDEDKAAMREMASIGGKGVPTFDIEGDVHSGYAPRWVEATVREHAQKRAAAPR